MTHLESGIKHDPKEIVLGRLKTTLREEFAQDPYHNIEHSADVDNISKMVCEMVKSVDSHLVSDHEELAREVAAYGHDSVIEYVDAIIDGPMKGKRVRRRGFLKDEVSPDLRQSGMGNEQASRRKIERIIDEVDPNHAVFKDVVIDEINSAVAATFPEVDFKAKVPDEKWQELDPRAREYFDEEGKGLRLYQPHLRPKSSVVTLAIALGDLSAAGFMRPEDSLEKGDAEYRETRDRIGWWLQKRGLEKLSNEEKKEIVADMKGWLRGQVQFYVWRKIETEKLINEHVFDTTKEHQEEIKKRFRESKIFKNFDEVITKAINREKKYESFGNSGSFVAVDLNKQIGVLAEELGYEFDSIQ